MFLGVGVKDGLGKTSARLRVPTRQLPAGAAQPVLVACSLPAPMGPSLGWPRLRVLPFPRLKSPLSHAAVCQNASLAHADSWAEVGTVVVMSFSPGQAKVPQPGSLMQAIIGGLVSF